jgi:hypothetical protein
LGLDVVGLTVPFLFGLGVAYRAGKLTKTTVQIVSKADDLADLIKVADKLDNVDDVIRLRKEFPWHHIFPKRADLAQKFADAGIDIHKYLTELPLADHIRIHSGAPRGGLWNKAWETFFLEHPEALEDPVLIYKQAGWLIHEFGLDGIVRLIP